MTLHLYSMFLPAFHIPIFNWLTSWPHNQDIPESSYFSLYPRNSHIIKQGGIESWKNQKALWRSWTKSEKNKLGTLSDQTAQGEAQSPGRQERVKSFPLQYKRKECAERLGFLLLQWELQKRREEAEEKKGGVSPLKTCRDWERKRERVRDRESERERERQRAHESVCLSLRRENISAPQWFALGERHQLASDPRGRPNQVTLVKTKWALPLPIPPLSTRECLGESSGNPNS